MRTRREFEPGVYAILCVPTGKMYIGSSIVDMLWRMKCHVKALQKGTHSSPYLQHSWDKYGRKNFKFCRVESCPPEKCLEREQYHLDTRKTYLPRYGFNVCQYAHNTAGRPVSAETRAKISKTLTGRKTPPHVVEKIRLASTGRVKSLETRAKISASNMGHTFTPEVKRHISRVNIAKGPLTREDVEYIHLHYRRGHSYYGQYGLAKRFKCSRCAIQGALRRSPIDYPESSI
jgi:group I intron endonuclease